MERIEAVGLQATKCRAPPLRPDFVPHRLPNRTGQHHSSLSSPVLPSLRPTPPQRWHSQDWRSPSPGAPACRPLPAPAPPDPRLPPSSRPPAPCLGFCCCCCCCCCDSESAAAFLGLLLAPRPGVPLPSVSAPPAGWITLASYVAVVAAEQQIDYPMRW